MIKMLTVHTFEIDDTDAAIREIQEQLQSQGGLLKNTVGLLFCYLDFINAGTVEAVCKALPFDTLGCTTLGAAIPDAMGDIILTLTVLTSDDVEFHTGLSEPLTEEEEDRVVKVYRETAAETQTPLSLILIITPSLYNLAGDMVVNLLDRESRGVPIFGTGALDADTKIRTPKTIYGGNAYSDRMPILLFSGNLAPRFFIDSVWDHNIHTQKALVTAAEGNRMITVNNIPAAEYMKEIGLITEERLDLLFVFPLAIYQDQSALPNLFIIYTINNDGSLTCSTNIPAGSLVHIGSPGSGEAINSAKNITNTAKKARGEAALIFSCFSRSVILSNPQDEMGAIREELKDSTFPYVFIYSGGEICPAYNEKGVAVNQYHNYTIVTCVLSPRAQ
ncbi:MAG: FIST C-terminal domain-containing protein [Treponema sp.]|jgi:hypothetical protein|nr:FIST C-terminal domain-containing protein [Treponema sp.]